MDCPGSCHDGLFRLDEGADFQVITSVIAVVKSLGATGAASLGSKEGFLETSAPAMLPTSSLRAPLPLHTAHLHLNSSHPISPARTCPRGEGCPSLLGPIPCLVFAGGRSGHCPSGLSAGSPGPQQLQVGKRGAQPLGALLAPLCLFIYYDFLVQLKGLLSRRV